MRQLAAESWRRFHNEWKQLRTRSIESSFSIYWVWPLQDGKAWRWHSKSRIAGIASDSDTTVGLSIWSVSDCVAKGSSNMHS